VKVGEGDPVAEAFQEFQRVIRALKDKGTLLAICSKNNLEDALEVFEKRPEMALAISDFSARRIDWEPKPANLASIAAELNIGEDSLVFIDDSPAECELVRQMLPHVKVIHLPKDPSLYAGLLRKSLDFEKLSLTAEDRVKGEQYREHAERELIRTQVGDLESYIEKLGTVVSLGPAREHHVPRVHQLFTKTNQFNATTQRYSLAEVEAFVADARFDVGVMGAKDKFGDLGIIGLYLVESLGEVARIDSVIMSCRALGRGMETALINRIKVDHIKSGRASVLEAEFRPTKKNKPVAQFFDQQGFDLVEASDDGSRRYRIEAGACETLECPGITVQSMEND
jgi:FkbH-like protein